MSPLVTKGQKNGAKLREDMDKKIEELVLVSDYQACP